jgi:arylformamidase
MKVIDISRAIGHGSVVWPGAAPLSHALASIIGPDGPYQETRLDGWTTHLLTHLDAPAHIIKGSPSLDQIHLARFMGDALVVEVKGDVVGAENIPPREACKGKALFFKTRNSTIETTDPFDQAFVFIAPEAAHACVEHGVTLVGIDYYSVDAFDSTTLPAHNILLRHDVLILEALQMKDVAPGPYHFAALPLKIKDADGSPVRAVLMTA